MNRESTNAASLKALFWAIWPELCAGILAAGFFAWNVLPGLHWYDGGEFGAVAKQLALSHPPGHPLHSLWSQLTLIFFPGDLAWRANLSSGLAFAFGIALLCRLLRDMLPQCSKWLAVLSALLPTCMPAAFVQGIRVEVYALQMLMSISCACVGWRYYQTRDKRWFWALGFCFGLAGCNHTYIALLMMPMALMLLLIRWPGWKSLLAGTGFGFLGLALYLYIPLRANKGAEIGWISPQNIKEVLWHISAFEWMQTPAVSYGGLSDSDDLIHYLLDQLGPISALIALCLITLAIISTLPLWDETEQRRAPLVMTLLLSACCNFANLSRLDQQNPDIGGYMSISMLCLAILMWLGASLIPKLSWLPIGIALLCMLPRFDPDHRLNSRTAELFGRQMMREIPPDGALLSSDYQTHFLTSALRCFEGSRPDAALIFRGQMHREGFKRMLEAHLPDWAALLDGFPESFQDRYVAVEPGVFFDEFGPLQEHLRPWGLTLQLGLGQNADLFQLIKPRLSQVPIGPENDLDARKALAFLHIQHLEHWLRMGHHPHLARRHFTRAADLAPGDPYLLELSQQLIPSKH